MKPRILLVNPPIHDFAAYDFWLKPYGLLTVAGYLRGRADFKLFDYMDRGCALQAGKEEPASDRWGRGRFNCENISRPPALESIPRYYRRFGLPSSAFRDFVAGEGPFDFALIQTVMTYWYQGVEEVIQDVRELWPKVGIVLGGNYATLCADHARRLGADITVEGAHLRPLWEYLQLAPDPDQPPLWEAYSTLNVGTIKLTDGCPFNCTYCSVPKVYGKFKSRSVEHSLAELDLLCDLGAENVAFYDDALLFAAEETLIPFLEEVVRRKPRVNFHDPNALNARFVTANLAELMVRAGFKTFYLGFESSSVQWQKLTGSKVFSDELASAVSHLLAAGVEPSNIMAYHILGHPHIGVQELERSMQFVRDLGIRGMLADFSPIPGTPDGDYCRKWVNMDEPLMHNKTAFPIILLGFDESNRLKDFQRTLNRTLPD